MEKLKQYNFFIITRLDSNEESDSLANIYDLSILNKIKERKDKKPKMIKKYYKNLINNNKTKIISQNKKSQIIKLIKKVILSSNLTYKWKITTFRTILIFFHLFFIISAITFSLKDKNGLNINNKITNITNNTIHNFTYEFNYSNFITDNKENNSYAIIDQDSKDKSKNNQLIFIRLLINQIVLIPIWFFFKFKLIPKWNKINDIIYKISNFFALSESYNNSNYFYYLMKDFSILITKKKYYKEKKNSLSIFLPKNEYLYEKNILLYCINIINDFFLDEHSCLNYHELISTNDYNDIKVLTQYIEKNIRENLKIFNKKVLSPLLFSIIICLFDKRASTQYIFVSVILLFLMLLLSEYILKEYIRKYKLNIDKFIDSYNETLIKKKRFIFRKNTLFMYFALKDDNYDKMQVINFIEKILNS